MNVKDAKLAWQLPFEGAWPTSVAFVGGGTRLAAGNRDGQIVVWDLPEEAPETEPKEDEAAETPPVRALVGHTNGISHLESTAEGWLISASLDRSIRLWDPQAQATSTIEVVLDSQQREKQARRLSDDKKKEILEAPGIEVESHEAAHVLEGHTDWVGALGLSADGSRLISGDDRSKAIVWDLPSRTQVARWQGYAWNGIMAAALSPDGGTALVSEYRYKRDDFDIPAAALKLCNVADGSERLDLLKIQFPKLDARQTSYGAAQVWRKFVAGGLVSVAFSPDGKLLAAGQGGETGTGKVHLFETGTGKLLRSVAAHQYGVTDVQFSPDGRAILSTGRDTTLQVCAVEDGKELAKLSKPRGGQFKDWLHALAISPDGRRLAAADIAGIVHVWQLPG